MSHKKGLRVLGLGIAVLATWSSVLSNMSSAAEGRTRYFYGVNVIRPIAEVAVKPAAAVNEAQEKNIADPWYRHYHGDYGAPNPGTVVQWYPVNPPYRHVPMFGAPSASFYPGGRYGRWDANGNWGYWDQGYLGYNGYTGW